MNTMLQDIVNNLRIIRHTFPPDTNHYVYIYKHNNYKHLVSGTNLIPSIKYHSKSIHAEHNGIQKLIRYNHTLKRTDKLIFIVIRMNKYGVLGNSRPCKGCIIRMIKFNKYINIRNIFYSYTNSSFRKEKLNDMYNSPDTKYSSGDNRSVYFPRI